MTDPACAVVTLFSANRIDHVRRQFAAVRSVAGPDSPLHHIAVCLDSHDDAGACVSVSDGMFDAVTVAHVPPGPHGMRLARGRNEGAAAAIAAGADVFVFLDADCLPAPTLFERYAGAMRHHPAAILCGPVTYLPETQQRFDGEALQAATSPHPARVFPSDGESLVAAYDEYALFWSLSFALSAKTWAAIGGFCEDYEGYGGEDTDFAFAARLVGVELVWVGGAHAYHQYHSTSAPPWQHLDAILRNGKIFFDRWGEWPMSGWLAAFSAAGAIAYEGGAWKRVEPPADGNTAVRLPVTV